MCVSAVEVEGLWNVNELRVPPKASWSLLKEKTVQTSNGPVIIKRGKVYFEGPEYNGKGTRIMAFFASPVGSGPFPSILLIHGGAGAAFSDWAELWASRGYVALAPDFCGHEVLAENFTEYDYSQQKYREKKERVPLENGGPGARGEDRFEPFTMMNNEYRNRWEWYATAAAIKSHALLDSLDQVDADKTAVTGISWGGYLATLLAGIDQSFQVVVPVYGCGHLQDGSMWTQKELKAMSAADRALWLACFDPSSTAAGVTSRILFVNGTNDHAYPLNIHRKTCYDIAHSDILLCNNLQHSNTNGWSPPEIEAYINSVLQNTNSLPLLEKPVVNYGKDKIEISAKVKHNGQATEATLFCGVCDDPGFVGGYDSNGKFHQVTWKEYPARIVNNCVVAEIPAGPDTGKLWAYLEARNEQGLRGTTHYIELESPTEE
ncbi:MAG: dienelactone hydrolase family protein [Planctomycetia bacterium]|nr:dienelactone hydrolase family protein [Planctomycetia bacterium]